MKTILVVDDNKLNLTTAKNVLNSDYKVIPVMKGQQALTYLEKGECDIILLDINMPEMDGFEVLRHIREMERCANLPVIFLTADNDAETETRCFKEGAVDFIGKPFVPEVMLSRIGRILEIEDLRRSLADRLEQKTREVSVIKSKYQQDALTGLWDRVYTEETVNRLLDRGCTGALLMLDVDNFKSINDNHGHIAGDEVLTTLAETLQSFFGQEDVLCRLGGDEFVVFMKDANKEVVNARAATLITALHQHFRSLGYSDDMSVSIGIALAPANGTEFIKLYNCADKALYHVKRNGKDAYHFFGDKFREATRHDKEPVDLKYLQALMGRTDDGKGAYLLELDSFHHVYNFIRRFADRSQRDVSLLLFTIAGPENEETMDALEKTVCTYLRRSDITTRYSTRQLVVVLMDANSENGELVAGRILENFYHANPEAVPGGIEYGVARMDSLRPDK